MRPDCDRQHSALRKHFALPPARLRSHLPLALTITSASQAALLPISTAAPPGPLGWLWQPAAYTRLVATTMRAALGAHAPRIGRTRATWGCVRHAWGRRAGVGGVGGLGGGRY